MTGSVIGIIKDCQQFTLHIIGTSLILVTIYDQMPIDYDKDFS